MRFNLEGPGFERVATIDIETTHYKPRQGETVSIGIGVHDRGKPSGTADYRLYHRDGRGEANLITSALDDLESFEADGLTSFNGREFDLQFLEARLQVLGEEYVAPSTATPETHIDLYEGRKAEANRRGIKWPSLEECVAAYGKAPGKTIWNGSEVTNSRFGEEVGPAFLSAVDADDYERLDELGGVVNHYLKTDLEANLALYHWDIGEDFEPVHLGQTKEF